METLFTIEHRLIDGTHTLTISPQKKNEGFPPKQIEVTEAQWNELRFHFATGVDDKNKVSILAYIK